jgi:hypothetical protein
MSEKKENERNVRQDQFEFQSTTTQRHVKPGFRFESYTDFVMGTSDDGFDYQEELDDDQTPLSPTTVQRILQEVWSMNSPP